MKVIIPTDFSDSAQVALETTLTQKWPDKTQFLILSVVEPIYAACSISGSYVGALVESHRQHIEALKEQMDKLVSATREKLQGNFEVSGVVVEGSPPATIVDKAKEVDADLIIMGSHGRSGFERFLLGSVAERVVVHAPCSVVIVKTKKIAEPGKELTQANLALA